jgi:hypothetical protein
MEIENDIYTKYTTSILLGYALKEPFQEKQDKKPINRYLIVTKHLNTLSS